MVHLADFQRLAQAKTHGMFAYDAARDQVKLESPRGSFFGRALAWLKYRVRGRNPAQEQVTEQFFNSVKSFYGENVLRSVLKEKAGHPFVTKRPPQLSARHVRSVINQSNVTAEQWLRPVLEKTKAAPEDVGPLWRSLAERQLLNSGYAQRLMQQESFPPGSAAEHLRGLIAGGFFRMFGDAPNLNGGPGNHFLLYRSEYVGTEAVRHMEESINLRAPPETLSVHQVNRFCRSGTLDPNALWKAMQGPEPIKSHPYGAQTADYPRGEHPVARDLKRAIASTHYDINGKTKFANPPALLGALWNAAKGSPDCFTVLCNLLMQTAGNEFHSALKASRLREYTDFSMQDANPQLRQLQLTSKEKGRVEVNWRVHDTQESGRVVNSSPSADSNQYFDIGAEGKTGRQQNMRLSVNSSGYATVERMHAEFEFFTPLSQIALNTES